jgi:hypothetical protein
VTKFTCTIDMNNSAFASAPTLELERILSKIRDQVRDGVTASKVLDDNGNTVGRWQISG